MAIIPVARPGSNVDIVVQIDFSSEKVDVRRSLIYDILEEERIILSQTNPPLTSRNIGNKVAVTYLVKETDYLTRYGFYGKIVELIKDYKLSSSEPVVAIVVERETDPVKFNIRMHFRVKPGKDNGLIFSIEGNNVNIIDISIGGARITCPRNFNIDPRTIVRGVLSIDGKSFDIEARVLRVWEIPTLQQIDGLKFSAMQFLNLNRNAEDELAKKVGQIERKQRFKEMFP